MKGVTCILASMVLSAFFMVISDIDKVRHLLSKSYRMDEKLKGKAGILYFDVILCVTSFASGHTNCSPCDTSVAYSTSSESSLARMA